MELIVSIISIVMLILIIGIIYYVIRFVFSGPTEMSNLKKHVLPTVMFVLTAFAYSALREHMHPWLSVTIGLVLLIFAFFFARHIYKTK